tara:strand:- start:2168 stop:2575 length:408 start_codon:yes stop_codon:yes gene_type:complete
MEPLDKELYSRVKAAAKRKFTVFPSAYASAWMTEEYKRRGGKYKGKKPKGGLKKWFNEKWVDISRPLEGGGFHVCGRADSDSKKYPKCVPERIAKKMTKEEIKSAVRRKRYNETIKAKGGKGRKPVNVKTFKKDK